MAIAGKVGAVYVSDVGSAPIPFSDKPTTPDVERKRYQVTDPVFRYWAPDEPVTVKVDGAVIGTGFTLEGAGGFVVFDEAQDEAVVTVSGSALTLVQAGGFFNWSLDTDADDLEVTTFESGGKKEFVRGLLGWSGSAEAYWGDDGFFAAMGEIVAIKLFIDAGPSQKCLEGYALINGVGVEASVGEIVQQSIEWMGVGPLYLRF